MDVRHHHDPQAFRALAEPFYASDPVQHTLALTVIARFITYAPTAAETTPVMMTLHDDTRTIGVVLRTPPWPVIASGLPTDPALLDAVVARWLERDPNPPGVNGPRDRAEAFARAWTRHTGGTATETMACRLYRLGDLEKPATAGRPRHATEDDVDLLVAWRDGFALEAHGHQRNSGDGPAAIRRALAMGDGTILWERDYAPVSWAVASAPIDGMSRIGPVYTPPEHRGKGYGSAVTAAVSQHARDAGATNILLFTDLANPTSNSIYRKIGYRPVYDSTELEFAGLPSGT